MRLRSGTPADLAQADLGRTGLRGTPNQMFPNIQRRTASDRATSQIRNV
jgi:hypothetical protein